ncbi:MAG: flavodoxin [Lentisphaeria bacterium]|nr:flavodoxin [Lentisphaeria bacterium]
MKKLVVYSSKTGNTKKIAEVAAEALGNDTVLAPVSEAPDYRGFDFVAVGFWIEKARPNHEIQKYIRRLKGKKVALFFTLGADPGSSHALECLEEAEAMFDGNEIVGHFVCQGKIDPALIKWMRQLPVSEGRAPMLQDTRWECSPGHPGAEDLIRARETFRDIAMQLQ